MHAIADTDAIRRPTVHLTPKGHATVLAYRLLDVLAELDDADRRDCVELLVLELEHAAD